MTSAGGLLDFFVLEASEYIEQLDGLLARAAGVAPDADEMLRVSRALRGSATMAKLPSIADLAAAIERVGRALQGGALEWDAALRATFTSAVDDLKILVRAVRNWSPAENQRATTRAAELSRYAPLRPAPPPSTPATTSGATYFSAEASNIAAGFDLLLARPQDADAAMNVLRRVRALRGVAGIKDVGPLATVMEAAELVMKPLELGEGVVTAAGVEVLRSGAELLRLVAAALRSGAPADASSAERDHFAAAVESFRRAASSSERIVPIAELFFSDGGPTVVSAAPNPPTTPVERFRLEIVSQGEHLQRLVDELGSASTEQQRERVQREVKAALASMRVAAESFGESEVADFIAAHDNAVNSLDYLGINALQALAQVIAKPGAHGEHLSARLAELGVSRARDAGIADAFSGTEPAAASLSSEARLSSVLRPPLTPSSAPTPIVNPAVPSSGTPVVPQAAASIASTVPVARRTPAPTPARAVPAAPSRRSGEQLLAALDAGISGIGALAEQPLSTPTPIEVPVVPIDVLLYRGRAAIERAIAIRDEVRQAGGVPQDETLAELFDLLDLALVE